MSWRTLVRTRQAYAGRASAVGQACSGKKISPHFLPFLSVRGVLAWSRVQALVSFSTLERTSGTCDEDSRPDWYVIIAEKLYGNCGADYLLYVAAYDCELYHEPENHPWHDWIFFSAVPRQVLARHDTQLHGEQLNCES
jgi:hypothetical protein